MHQYIRVLPVDALPPSTWPPLRSKPIWGARSARLQSQDWLLKWLQRESAHPLAGLWGRNAPCCSAETRAYQTDERWRHVQDVAERLAALEAKVDRLLQSPKSSQALPAATSSAAYTAEAVQAQLTALSTTVAELHARVSADHPEAAAPAAEASELRSASLGTVRGALRNASLHALATVYPTQLQGW